MARPDGCAHRLFEARVERTPDAVATISNGASLTYRELDGRANAVARDLVERGVGPESIVGVSVERSAELVVALLGVLKAGGACLPLDPAYPAERRAFMVTDSGAVLVLDRIEPGTAERLPCRAEPGDAAYVIYTSGSTGQPKGVVIEHHALCLYAAVAADVTPGERRLFSAAIGFSASVRQLILPLLYGRTVVIASEDERVDVRRTLRLAREQRVTVWDTTPSVLEAALEVDDLEGLDTILVTGEPLPAATAARVPAGVELVNLYSQTETVGTVTSHVVEPGATVLAGHPLDQVRVHVLDADLQPADEGDVWIGGPRLARGYIGDSERTAEAFRPAPDGGRMYRTGDVGRLRADGALELLGRRDRRVNVAGIRVELGEVEAALLREPAVTRAAVVWRDGRLKAVVVATVGARELQRRVARWLPRHMVPADLAVVDELPLLVSGKLDWEAVAALRGERSLLAAHVAPATPAEQRVAQLFEQVLGVPEVGAQDDFFALGGDSLLATRLLARLGRDVPLRWLFESPTPRELSPRLDAAPVLDAALPRATDDRMSFAQERLWLVDELGVGTGVYNVARALRLRGPLDVARLERALRTIVERHEVLRARFALVDGVPRMIVGGNAFALRVADDADLDAEAARPFTLSAGELFRALLVRRGPDEHVLALTAHHIVCDGWSIGILIRELAALYAGARRYRRCPSATPTSPPGSARGQPTTGTGGGSSPGSPRSSSCPRTARARRSRVSPARPCASRSTRRWPTGCGARTRRST